MTSRVEIFVKSVVGSVGFLTGVTSLFHLAASTNADLDLVWEQLVGAYRQIADVLLRVIPLVDWGDIYESDPSRDSAMLLITSLFISGFISGGAFLFTKRPGNEEKSKDGSVSGDRRVK